MIYERHGQIMTKQKIKEVLFVFGICFATSYCIVSAI